MLNSGGTDCKLHMDNEIENSSDPRRTSSTAKPNWADDGRWKKRYSRLYTVQRRSLLGYATTTEEDHTRISFLSKESTPYTDLYHKKGSQQMSSDELRSSATESAQLMSVLPFHRQSTQSDNLVMNETALLDLVRAKNRSSQDTQISNTNMKSPEKEEFHEVAEDHDSCMRNLMNLGIRTERSVSRSRMSRISTRRDMDIPSILAYNVDEGITAAKPHRHLEIPAFQIATTLATEPIPRWSIRRSVCPVCSQKWRDKSFISKIRSSGNKRKSSLDLLSVVAPARLRTSITLKYAPRPAPVASDEEAGVYRGGLRNNSATWQLARARRFRTPKINLPPEATAPPVFIEPMVRKDLDNRVQKFLAT